MTTREDILSGPDGRLLSEIRAQTILTGVADKDLVLEAVFRELMEPMKHAYIFTDKGHEAVR